MILQLLFWLPFCFLLAFSQGLLLPAIRLTPPGAEARRQSFALHVLLGTAYFAPLAFSPTWQALGWGVAAALLVRMAAFDVLLNAGAGSPLLYVGFTAGTDKLLRKLAPNRPELLAGLVRAACLTGYVGLVIYAIN